MEAFPLLQRSPTSRRVSMSRENKLVSLLVLHSDPRPAEETLAALLASEATQAPHYYLAAAGTTVALVPEARAAQHSGVATWRGRRRNIDRISIGVVLEHTPGSIYTPGQQEALFALVAQLRERHGLEGTSLVGWEADGQGLHRSGALLAVAISPDAFFDVSSEVEQQLADERRRLVAFLDALEVSRGDDDAALWTALQQETYAARGGEFQADWAFHRVAIAHNLGAPLARSANASRFLKIGSQTYGYQPFARDTLISPTDNWSTVQRLTELLGGNIPNDGLARRALEASYQDSSGSLFHADWAFHQLAVREQLGSPLSGNYSVAVDGQRLALQVFAGDTLYTLIAQPEAATNWLDVRRLSQTPTGALADALWKETYKPCGAAYQPDALLPQTGLTLKLGAPLSGVRQLTVGATAYQVQIFALDTLYAGIDGVVRRLGELPHAIPNHVVDVAPAPQLLASATSSTSWLAEHPNAPQAARRLIDQAVRMLGPERVIFDTLPDKLRRLAYGAAPDNRPTSSLYFKDIVCADLVTICLDAAGLDYAWRVTEPAGKGKDNPHCANYYRASARNPKLRQLDDNDPSWLPGDILIYWYSGEPATDPADHVNLYIGPFVHNGQTFDIVEASINYRGDNGAVQGLSNVPRRKSDCWDHAYFKKARRLFRMRLVELEQAYRTAGVN